MAWRWMRTRAEDREQLMASYGISVKDLSQTKDHNSLERDAAKDSAIYQTLSSDSYCPNLAHLLSTVRHPLVHHVAHLQTQLPDQVEVQHGAARRGEVG